MCTHIQYSVLALARERERNNIVPSATCTNADAHRVCLTLTKMILYFVHFGEFAVIMNTVVK